MANLQDHFKLSFSYLWDNGTQIKELSEVYWNANHICKGKGGKITETKPIVKVKIASALVNMVDVHATIQSKASEEYVFKD